MTVSSILMKLCDLRPVLGVLVDSYDVVCAHFKLLLPVRIRVDGHRGPLSYSGLRLDCLFLVALLEGEPLTGRFLMTVLLGLHYLITLLLQIGVNEATK